MLDLNDNELLALHRYIFETKFTEDSNDIAFTPFLAEIAHKVLDAIIDNYKINNIRKYENLTKWRLLTKDRIEWHLIKDRIKKDKNWSNFDNNQKLNYLRIFFSPLIVTEEVFLDFISEE